MNIAVFTKPNTSDHKTRKSVLDALRADGDFRVVECTAREIPDGTDRVLVFGGDGTMLDAVRAVGGRNIPVLGVNLGYLGFLSAFESDASAESIVGCLKGGKTVSRMLLSVDVCGLSKSEALNEVVIKSAGTRPITLDVSVDGHFADSFHSDGVIISSPAGSTAYSLSAGGPVLAPDVEATVIIPICAHSLHSRPLVVNSSSVVTVKLSGEHCANVSVDGADNGNLSVGGCVTVTKSQKSATFLTDGNENFYAKLLKKMNRWGTTER